MNRQANVAVLVPFYVIGVLAVLVLAATAQYGAEFTTDTTIGEKQEAVLHAHGQADALRVYAHHAAREAIREASNTATTDTLEETLADTYRQLLASNPQHPVYATSDVEVTGREATFTTNQPLTIPITYGETPASTTRTTAVFGQWPVDGTPVITSLFGGRDVSGGSPNHPGIDIRAAPGDDVRSLAAGEVTGRSEYAVWVRMDNSYTCGYLHVQPLKEVGEAVRAGEAVARVTQQEGYDAHLDIRCYNHDQPLGHQAARSIFGDAHVADAYTTVSDTTLVATTNQPARSYIDPYCLFSQDIRDAVKNRITQDDSLRNSLSGLEYRNQSLTPAQRLDETCSAYQQRGLLVEAVGTSEHYLDAVVTQILEAEGEQCTDRAADRGGRTKWGVTADTLSAYRGIPAAQARQEVCSVTREQAREIFLNDYLYRPGFDELPAQLLPQVFDMSVNHGQATASRLLQEVLVEQGFLEEVHEPLTPLPAEALSASEEAMGAGTPLNELLADRRVAYYRAIVENDESQRQFLEGWLNRAEKYRSSSTLPTGAGAQGEYTFTLTLTEQLPREALEAVRSRTDLKRSLQRCDYGDESCISAFAQPHGFAACTAHAPQLQAAVAQCAQQFSTGCSCALPLPGNDTAFSPQTLRVDEEIVGLDWAGQGDEGALEVYLAVEAGDVTLATQEIGYTGSQPFFTTEDGLRSIDPFDGRLYVRTQRAGSEVLVLFSATNSTQMCEQTVRARYCAGDQRLSVEHPVGAP